MSAIKEKLNLLRGRLLHGKGLKVLQEFDAAMRGAGIPYTLIYGTLLGAVREKGFIRHDFDIDVAVWSDTDRALLHRTLREAGFRFKRSISVQGGKYGLEECFSLRGIRIDMDFVYTDPADGRTYIAEYFLQPGCSWQESKKKYGGLKVLQIPLPVSRETEYLPFENTTLPVTKSALDFVEARYGKNWRVPDPTFVWPKIGDASYIEHPDWLGVISHDEHC